MSNKRPGTVPSGTFRQFSHDELKPNPRNPRRLFDRVKLDVLEDSIRKNGILVPLTVYLERNGQHYILDGERRWRCAEKISTDATNPKQVPIPANVVDPPSAVANVLWMFNIHNLREQWELMPTALSLQVLMKELKETNDEKLADLTKLSVPHVRRCKTLLSFPDKYQKMMLHTDPDERVKANFFIELAPVLDLFEKLPKKCAGGKGRSELTDHFLALYKAGKISSVIHFRRVLEAHDHLEEGERFDDFLEALQTLTSSTKHTIRQLFDPLVAEDKSVATAEQLCKDFLSRLRRLKIAHTTRRGELRKLLNAVQDYVSALLTKLEG
jgi:ParB/RepB/Spo0J family partition protein